MVGSVFLDLLVCILKRGGVYRYYLNARFKQGNGMVETGGKKSKWVNSLS